MLANNGFKAGKEWNAPDGKEFKVELVSIDDPVAMRNAYAAGEVHIGWATLDMVPLFMEGFVDAKGNPIDSRHAPRLPASRLVQRRRRHCGAREHQDRGRPAGQKDGAGAELAVALLRPQHAGGRRRAAVRSEMIFTDDAFQAAAAFNAQKDISGGVSWAPDIYNLSKVKGNRMLVTTQTPTS